MSLFVKRIKYDNGDQSSTEEETCEDSDYNTRDEVRTKGKTCKPRTSNFDFQNEIAGKHFQHRPKRKPTCSSKNALLARENRLRKKMYVSKLEGDVTSLRRDNKKLSLIVDNQSSVISELKKQVKYLKSVIANSSDISRLIRNIHQSSGMSVSSSLDKNLSMTTCYIPKPKQPVSKKTAHPWDQFENSENESPKNYLCAINNSNDDYDTELFKDLDISLELPNQDLLDGLFLDQQQVDNITHNNDHNYTMANGGHNPSDDVGVCLHVSKQHVSLEFCQTCSENALQAWVG